MEADRVEEITALLVQAEQAHGVYEGTDLNGVYDQDWPQWYASFADEHGIGTLIGHEVTVGLLAEFLASSNATFQQTDPRPTESWAAYTARRIAEEL